MDIVHTGIVRAGIVRSGIINTSLVNSGHDTPLLFHAITICDNYELTLMKIGIGFDGTEYTDCGTTI